MDYSVLPKQNCIFILIAALAGEVVQQLDSTITYEAWRQSFYCPG